MTEIQIPDESIQVLLVIGDGIYETDEEVLEDARKIALPVLAAELRRILDDAFPDEDSDYHYGCERLLDLVRDRAAELSGEVLGE